MSIDFSYDTICTESAFEMSQPQIDINNIILSAIVGFLGSATYLTALYFRFVGSDSVSRGIMMEPFCRLDKKDDKKKKISIKKCAWYCFMGSFVAGVFQVGTPNFVAVQSLILGATWPAIVTQFLSGRLTSPSGGELKENIKELEEIRKNSSEGNLKEVEEILKKKDGDFR